LPMFGTDRWARASVFFLTAHCRGSISIGLIFLASFGMSLNLTPQ